jgi:hypothetical protein
MWSQPRVGFSEILEQILKMAAPLDFLEPEQLRQEPPQDGVPDAVEYRFRWSGADRQPFQRGNEFRPIAFVLEDQPPACADVGVQFDAVGTARLPARQMDMRAAPQAALSVLSA